MKPNPCVRTCRKRDEKAKEEYLATNAIKSKSRYSRRCEILHINIGNLKRKMEDIKDDYIVKNSHIISLNETHLGHSDILTPDMMGISKGCVNSSL